MPGLLFSLDAVLAKEIQKDRLVCDTLGPHILDKYVEAKQVEWHDYTTRVHQWEVDNYLSKY